MRDWLLLGVGLTGGFAMDSVFGLHMNNAWVDWGMFLALLTWLAVVDSRPTVRP